MDQIFDEFIAELENIGEDNGNQPIEEEQGVVVEVINSSSNSDNSSSGKDELESQFAKIACSGCRKSHLACDRIKPSCSECIMRKRPCQYIPPKKRGRVKGNKKNDCNNSSSSSSSPSSSTSPTNTSTIITTVNMSNNNNSKKKKLAIIAPSATTNKEAKRATTNGFHPYLSKQQQTYLTRERNLVKGNIHHAIVNYFFDFVDVNFDFLSREQMEEIVANVDLYEKEYSVRTLLSAVQSLCEQSMSQTERSLNSFRESVHYSSLAHPVDFCTKVSKVLLTMFTIGDGQTEMAWNYLNYIKDLENDPYLDDVNKLKFKMIASKGEAHISIGDDDLENSKFVGKSFTKFYDHYVNDNKYDSESINNGITLENAASTLSLIYSVRDFLYNKIANKKLSDPQKQIKHATIELMHNYGLYSTLKLLNFNADGLNELVEKVELLLFNFSLILPLYSFHNLAVFVRHRINQFNSIRIRIIEKIGQGRNIRSIFEDEEEKKYFEKVLQHIKLVNSFAARYRMIHRLFPRLVRELNSIVKWKFDLQMTCLSACITDEMSNELNNVDITNKKESNKDESRYQSCIEKCRASNHIFSI
ncbi:predicted protein [Naegleria gruberi]|uniref:Predicted protein n=1 Tax=Naegleria gruberi TaxID=5762 RepID=D2VCH9_NAEGR|nr:uncharacterized protein NAEGRDRAFT_48429 [Naegleria gruberi]EFC45419.1 predicted protein [Naegleria gruberi]|eukprot:XP_002678163.1 predicted protein [Naegleria gruberi strain NEG-M]